MKSNWEHSRTHSNYHFNDSQLDAPNEWFWHAAHFKNTWSRELDLIISKQLDRPINWQTRKYTNNRTTESLYLTAEESDITAAGGDAKMHLVNVIDDFAPYPNLQAVIDSFGLDLCIPRLHLQYCGQVWNQHVDNLSAVYPDVDPSAVRKYIVMLTDWTPGHYYNYGTTTYQGWRAGDAHEFDWKNVPHGTANSSYQVRASLNIMGIDKERLK